MSILAVDPGIVTGWCEFQLGKLQPNILATGQVTGNHFDITWESRVTKVCKEFATLIREKKPQQVWLEQPEAFSSTTSQSGSQFKLDCVCGMLIGACVLYHVPWFFVRVREWKGQVPKVVSNQRTRAMLGLNGKIQKQLPPWYPKNEHSWDALGIACFVNKKHGLINRKGVSGE